MDQLKGAATWNVDWYAFPRKVTCELIDWAR